jgi:sugar/nucleoside kinase (ribokinase family)
VTYDYIEQLKSNYNGIIFVDSKKPDLVRFSGCVVKINEYEFNNRTSDHDNLIVTYGGNKVTYKDKIYYPPKIETYDACGCGDTFISAFVHQYIRTKNDSASIEFAMKAASVTVRHMGVYSPSLEEINEA